MQIRIKRIIAALIDHVICTYLAGIIPAVIGSIIGDDYVFHMMLFALLFYSVLFIFRDLIFKNASIGKRILGIKILRKDDIKISAWTCILRNLILVLLYPIETYLIFKNGDRLGDRLTGTMVINTGDGSLS